MFISERCSLVRLVMAGALLGALAAPTSAQTYPDGLYAEISTTKGMIVLALDLERAPMTVASFVGLAEGTIDNEAFAPGRPFFDGSLFGRVVAGHGEVHRGMDVVRSIELGDRMDSVRIVRVGREAEAFHPITESFGKMVEAVWESVREAGEEKARFEAEYVRTNWPDAETAADGWRYVVLEDGSGSAPALRQRLSLRYTGHTPQGLEFASTADECGPSWRSEADRSGERCDYVVGESSTTRGLDAAVAQMKPGARWIVIVPSALGYPSPGYYPAERPGAPRFHISPNTLLIYEVEVVQ